MKQIPFTSIVIAFFCAACSSPPKTEVTVIDYRNTEGAYVLVYSGDEDFRIQLEDRLVSDLALRELKGFPSHPDIPDVQDSSRDEVLNFARAKKAMFVLVVEEVAVGQAGVVDEQAQITQAHPTLRDFYQQSLPKDYEYAEDDQVFVEVSAFLIQENTAKLVWSGTTWSLQADGEGDRIADLSTTITDAIRQAQRKRRLGLD